MDFRMLAIAVVLGVLALTLLGVLRHLHALAAQLSLLDRDQLIPKIRRGLKMSIVGAASFSALALGASWWVPSAPDIQGNEVRALEAQLESAHQQIRDLQSQVESKPEPSTPVAEAPAAPAPAPVPQPAAPPPVTAAVASPTAAAVVPSRSAAAPKGEWQRGRIVATGEVTLREWPNGRALLKVPPGSRMLVSPERKVAGDYDWRKIRLADGTNGWIVEHFLALE